MKKILLTLVAMVCFQAMYAQIGLHVGALAGFGQSSILNKNDFDEGPSLDFASTWKSSFGLQLQYNFSDGLGVGTQLLYSGMGQKYTGVSPTTSIVTNELENKVNYLKIPILLHLNTNPEKMVGFHAYLGPQFALLVGGKTTNNVLVSGTVSDKYEADKDGWTSSDPITGTSFKGTFSESPYKSMDLGVVLGLGANINISEKLIIQAGLRMDYGLGDMENKGSKTLLDGTDLGYTWNEFGSKSVFLESTVKREASHNASGTFVVGVKYVL